VSDDMAEQQVGRIEAIICSMTPDERKNPGVINASRKRRISKGSGTTVQEVNQLLKQFDMMKKMITQMQKGAMRQPGFGKFR